MGYKSDVRIKLLEKDYKRLVEGFKPIADKLNYNLFDKKELTVCKELNEMQKVVYFGWNDIKWYDAYLEDIKYIMNFVTNLQCYAFLRIGEEDGDVDARSLNMYNIPYHYIFDDD